MLKRPGPVEHSTLTIQHSSEAGPDGAVAQLGEHLLCKQGVVGSIPISSTRPPDGLEAEPEWPLPLSGCPTSTPQNETARISGEHDRMIELSAGLRDRKFLDN